MVNHTEPQAITVAILPIIHLVMAHQAHQVTLVVIQSILFSDGTSGTSSNYGGNTTYHSFDNGLSGSSSNYGGNTTYHSFDNGLSGSSSNYGGNLPTITLMMVVQVHQVPMVTLHTVFGINSD